jgi:argininosuccinate lyase
MMEAARDGFMNATDLADYLVGRGLPFRSAHGVAGRIVQHCLGAGLRIEEMALAELRRFSPLIDKDVYRYLSAESLIARRREVGGTARANVVRRLKELEV